MAAGRFAVLVAGFTAAITTLGWCQSSSASLRGTIVDPGAAVVAGAELTIANEATGFSRTVHTNDQGMYQFLELPPNAYVLTMRAAGFASVRLEGVQLMVNTPATINQTLSIKAGRVVVEVMDTAPLVNTQDASQGHAFGTTLSVDDKRRLLAYLKTL